MLLIASHRSGPDFPATLGCLPKSAQVLPGRAPVGRFPSDRRKVKVNIPNGPGGCPGFALLAARVTPVSSLTISETMTSAVCHTGKCRLRPLAWTLEISPA